MISEVYHLRALKLLLWTEMIHYSSINTFVCNYKTQPYLQFELKLSTVARFLTRNGDLTTQLQGHGTIQDA